MGRRWSDYSVSGRVVGELVVLRRLRFVSGAILLGVVRQGVAAQGVVRQGLAAQYESVERA